MQQSSAEAARLLQQHGASACTDVTGFGLLGHLAEMTRPSQVPVTFFGPCTQAHLVSQYKQEMFGCCVDGGWVCLRLSYA